MLARGVMFRRSAVRAFTHDLRLSYGNTHSRYAENIHGRPQTFYRHAIWSIRQWCV